MGLYTSGLSYLVDVVILGLYALIGATTAHVPLLYAAVAGLATLGSFLLFSTRIGERKEDFFLSGWQVLVGTGIQLGFLALAPEVGLVFITVLFIVFGFGALRVGLWQAVLLVAVATLGLLAVLTTIPTQSIVPLATPSERWVTVLALAAALGRAVWLGLVGSTYRRTLAQRSAALRQLQGVLPICSHCKKIRDDEGAWKQLEEYISRRAGVEFSHGICGQCLSAHYPDDGRAPRRQETGGTVRFSLRGAAVRRMHWDHTFPPMEARCRSGTTSMRATARRPGSPTARSSCCGWRARPTVSS